MHLVGNALKFTPAGGTVTLLVAPTSQPLRPSALDEEEEESSHTLAGFSQPTRIVLRTSNSAGGWNARPIAADNPRPAPRARSSTGFWTAKQWLRFEVTNTGAGIPTAKQHLLFQPFSKARQPPAPTAQIPRLGEPLRPQTPPPPVS